MKKIPLYLLLALLAAVTFPASAADAEEPDAADALLEETEPNPLYALFYKVDDLLSQEKKDEATELILAGLDNPEYAKQKTELFTVVIRFLLYTEQTDKAKSIFLETIRTKPEMAEPGFDLIYGMLHGADPEAALAWARELLEQPLTPAMRQTATSWIFDNLLEKDPALVLDELKLLDPLSSEDACAVANRLCAATYRKSLPDVLDKLLASFGSGRLAGEASMKQTLASYTFLGKALANDWDAAQALLPALLKDLPERPLQMTLSLYFTRARRENAVAALEASSDAVYRAPECKDYKAIRGMAAREWVYAGFAADHNTLPQRVAFLRESGLPASQIFSNINRHFYDVMEEKNVLAGLLDEMEALSPLVDDEGTKNGLVSLMLDASFLVEDYERALALLEKGVPDKDEEWHAMAKAKVGAHIAQKKGDIDGAVARYREFMKYMAAKKENTPDPTTNVTHTPEMIQGLNARRIGDIYKEAGRADDAAKAYAEAKSFYEAALVKAQGSEEEKGLGEETVAYIKEQLKDL